MKRRSAFAVVGVAVVLLLLGVAAPAAASTITLGDPIVLNALLDSGSITVGDKLFDQFSYSATGDMPAASGVNVIAIQDDDGNYGLRFQGGFVDTFGDGPSDALIAFRVSVLDPMYLISDVHLAGNPDVLGPPGNESGLIGLTETFLTDDLAELSIYNLEPVGGTQLLDWVVLTQPLQSLHVQKNIIAYADDESSVPTLSFVDQTFSQVAAVPEPSTISLLTLGIGLVWALRRRLAHDA